MKKNNEKKQANRRGNNYRKNYQNGKLVTPRIYLSFNPNTGTIDISSSMDLDLATVRGIVEEARDNLAGINNTRWHEEQFALIKNKKARQKREDKWSRNEKKRLHESNENK